MKLKRGVDWKNVHPILWLKLAEADERHKQITGQEMVITSLRRAPTPRPSKHSPPRFEIPCTAADIRRWTLDGIRDETVSFSLWMQRELGLGVLLEPEWMTEAQISARGGLEKIAPHIHVQLKLLAQEPGFEWAP